MSRKQKLDDGRLGEFLGAVAPSGLGVALVVLWAIGLQMKRRNAATVALTTEELAAMTGCSFSDICTAMKAIREDGHEVTWQGRDRLIVTLRTDKRVDLFGPWLQELDVDDCAKAIVAYLNARTGKDYRLDDRARAAIQDRISDGLSIDELRHVVDVKVEQWMGTDMEGFLRPQTLFGEKAADYAQERLKEQIDKDNQVSREDLGRMWAG